MLGFAPILQIAEVSCISITITITITNKAGTHTDSAIVTMATDCPRAASLVTKILSTPPAVQNDSPLFRQLPPEIRSEIFAYALTDIVSPLAHKAFCRDTCYTRPGYSAPRRTETALLQTCRAIYGESWHLPFSMREQVHWATREGGRAPPGYDFEIAMHKMALSLRVAKEQRWRQPHFEIQSLRVFAQTFMLEWGNLARLLRTEDLHPRSLNLTVRHADWCNWEEDEPLRLEGKWLPAVNKVLSSSVREVRVELETLERKKKQVDCIAAQMRDRWWFKRADGVVLFADADNPTTTVTRWQGTSRWHDRRWVRDERADGVIDYYVKTIVFRPAGALMRKGVPISPIAQGFADSEERPSDEQLRLWNPAVYERLVVAEPFVIENERARLPIARRSMRRRG